MTDAEFFNTLRSLNKEREQLALKRQELNTRVFELCRDTNINLVGRFFCNNTDTYCKVIKEDSGVIIYSEVDIVRKSITMLYDNKDTFLVNRCLKEISEEEYLDKLRKAYSYYE